jgi:hypothetical protein
MYLINEKAEVIKKLVPKGQKNLTLRAAEGINSVSIDEASVYQNKLLSVANNSQINQPDKPFLRALVNWDVGSITSETIQPQSFIKNHEEIQAIRNTKGKTIIGLEKHFVADDQYVYVTTPISDSIYVFAGSELVKSIYAGIASTKIADYQSYMALKELKIQSSGGNGSVSNILELNQPPYYTNLYLSPNKKYLYRILSEKTKPAIHPYSNAEYSAIAVASLIVIDLSTEDVTSFELPVDKLKISLPKSLGIFVSDEGLHFQVKEQENENEIQFRVFGIK